MAQPPAYTPVHSFISDSATLANFPGQALDVEFNDVKLTTDAIRTNLALIQRDDGALKNGVVTYDSLAASVQTNGLSPALPWLTHTLYGVGTGVIVSGSLYRCTIQHTSGTFATDLLAGDWVFVSSITTSVAGVFYVDSYLTAPRASATRTQVTTAANAAGAACSAAGGGLVVFGAGSYFINDQIIGYPHVNFTGLFKGATIVDFLPTVANKAAFYLANGASTFGPARVSNMTIYSSDTALVKIGILCIDGRDVTIDHVQISGAGSGSTWHDTTNSSVGIQLYGRDSYDVHDVTNYADNPFNFFTNPNQGGYTLDQSHFWNITQYSATNTLVSIAGGVVTNMVWDGTQEWLGGVAGLVWKDLTSATHNSTGNIFKHIRLEQAFDVTAWAFDVEGHAASNVYIGVSFENIICGDRKGWKLRNVMNCELDRVHFLGTGVAYDIDGSVNGFKVSDSYWYTGSSATVSGQSLVGDIRYGSSGLINLDASQTVPSDATYQNSTSGAVGIKLRGAASGGGAAFSVVSPSGAENLTIDALGVGTIVIGSVSSGNVGISRSLSYGGVLFDNLATGSGSLVAHTSPTLVTPILGAATATTVNKVTITAPASAATLTLIDGTTLTGPAASGTAMTLGNAETVTGIKTFGGAGAVGKFKLAGTTSGTTILDAFATASGTLTLPAATDTLVGKATTDTLTNKTYDTAGAGNSFSINGVAVTANTGTGAVARAASPTFTGTVNAASLTASGTLTLGSTSFAANSGGYNQVYDGSSRVTMLLGGADPQNYYRNTVHNFQAIANSGNTSVIATGSIVSQTPTGGVGYSTGAGGTGTQASSKSTTTTLSPAACICGQVTMNGAALAAATIVSFSLTNTAIAATDVLILNHISGGTIGAYTLNSQAGAGSATINVRNNTAGSLSEAIVIQFAVIKAVNA